jgi:hypothetical protein
LKGRFTHSSREVDPTLAGEAGTHYDKAAATVQGSSSTNKVIRWDDAVEEALVVNLPVPDSWPQLSHAPIAVAHPSRESAEKGQQQLAWLIAKGINDEAVAEHLCERIADHASTVHLYVPSSRPFPMFFQDASNPKFDDVVANNLVFASLMGEALKGRIEALKKARLATDNALTASTAFREALKAGVEFFDEHVVPRLEKNHSRLFLIHGLEADCTFMLGKSGVPLKVTLLSG